MVALETSSLIVDPCAKSIQTSEDFKTGQEEKEGDSSKAYLDE